MVGIMSISGLAFGMTHAAAGAVRRQRVPAAAADRRARLRARHRPADGERLHPDRDAARAGADQARRHADGRAHVRHVQRHAVDDHAAGGVRGLCRGQYRRTDGWTTGWIACLVGWSTFILPFLFVLDAEPADGRAELSDRLEFRAHPVRAVRRHGGDRRLCAGAAVAAGAPALRLRRAADRAAAGELHRRLHHQLHRHRRRHRAAGGRPSAAEAAQGDDARFPHKQMPRLSAGASAHSEMR